MISYKKASRVREKEDPARFSALSRASAKSGIKRGTRDIPKKDVRKARAASGKDGIKKRGMSKLK